MDKKPINIDPEILSGTPVFAGTRVPVHCLFGWLETETLDEFPENFPAVSRKQGLQILNLSEVLVTNKKFLDEVTS